MMNRLMFCSLIFTVLLISGCNGAESTGKELDYEQTKKMVVDILKTDEGKQAVHELLTDDKMKQHLIMDNDVVQQSIANVVTSDESVDMWKKLFDDSEFVQKYTEALDGEQKKLFKGLMHDAAFQKQMLELLQNPEITAQTLTVLKSQQFREHLEEVIQQTLDSPLYKAKIEDILLKAGEDKAKSESEEETSEEEEDEE